MSIWQEILKKIELTENEKKEAKELYDEYIEKSYLSKTPSYLVKLSDNVIIKFYAMLSEIKDTLSPVRDKKNSKWMLDSDFTFINVRATGLGNDFGNFIQASKVLPAMRVQSIHLGPFTEYNFNVIYDVLSVESISPDVVNYPLEKVGFDREEQLKAFVEAAHILDKTVGFDLEPHSTQYSNTALSNPEIFRWIKLNDKKDLDYGITYYEMTRKKWQDKISDEIRKIVENEMEKEGLKSLEYEKNDNHKDIDIKTGIYLKIISILIKKGYWMIPAQAWNCYGIPEYKAYNHNGNYPIFDYRCEEGYENSGNAMHVICNYKFYDNIGVNNKKTENLVLNQKALDYFSNIFTKWRDDFGFDFIRHDSMDHIFDSANGDLIPLSDRATPFVLKKCIEKSKEGKAYIGNLAERMGNEFAKYSEIGYDLVLGSDMLEDVNDNFMKRAFEHYNNISNYNNQELKGTICFAIDTHDTGNPALQGSSLIEKYGFEKMKIRLFLSRFLNVGRGKRVKYEVLGLQDLSHGLFPSNVYKINIKWKNNEEFCSFYNKLEDVYKLLKGDLENSKIKNNYIEKDLIYWEMENSKKIIIALITLGKSAKDVELDLMKKYKKIVKYNFVEKEEIIDNEITNLKLINKGENGVFLFEIIK